MSRPASAFRGFVVGAATLGVMAGGCWALAPSQPTRNRAILFALAVCLVGTAGAAAAAAIPTTTAATRAAVPLLGIGWRLGPALVALAWLQSGGSDLRAAGAATFLAAFYLAALAADIVRIIIWERNSGRTPRGSRPN